MSVQRVFCNGKGDPMPIYLQEDAPQLDIDKFKVLIQDYGGAVVESPRNALIIIIINRQTPFAVNLINQYSRDAQQEIVSQGVVRHEWILDCIMQRGMLAPPGWGGHYLQPPNMNNFFAITSNVPIVQNHSPATIFDAMDSPSQAEPSTGAMQGDPDSIAAHQSTSNPPGPRPAPNIEQSGMRISLVPPPEPNLPSIPSTNFTSNLADRLDLPDMPPSPPAKHPKVQYQDWHLFTEHDDRFIRDYVSYAKRNGLHGHPQATYEAISKLMPWHSAKSIALRLSRKPELKGSSPCLAASSAIQPTENPAASASTPISQGSHVSETTACPNPIASWPDDEPPPPPPHSPQMVAPGRYSFTPEDNLYIVSYAKWCSARYPDISFKEFADGLFGTAPHHSVKSWKSHIQRYQRDFRKEDPLLARFLAQYLVVDTDTNQDCDSSESDEAQENANALCGPRKRKPSSKMVASSASISPTANTRIESTDPKEPELFSQSSRKGRGAAFTQEDFDAMAQHLANNPQAFFNPSLAAPGDLPLKGRGQVWTEFAIMHPGRSDKCWAQHHRLKNKDLEAAASRIIETMYTVIHDDDVGSPSEPPLTDGAGELPAQAEAGSSSAAFSSIVEGLFRQTSLSSDAPGAWTGSRLRAAAQSKRPRSVTDDSEPENNPSPKRWKGKEKQQAWTVLEDEDDWMGLSPS